MIAVLGDVMLDKWEEYTSTRLNPEDRDSKVTLRADRRYLACAGGALNVKGNLEALGCPTVMVSTTHEISIKHRIVVDGRVVVRIDDDATPTPPFLNTLAGYEHAVVVDYGKGAIDQAILDNVLASALDLLVLDLKPTAHRWLFDYQGPVRARRIVCKANESETFELVRSVRDWRAMYRGTVQPALLVMTRGASGAWAQFDGLDHLMFPGYGVPNPRSVCGAGDAFTAALVHGVLEHGLTLDCVREAVYRTGRLVREGQRTLCFHGR